MNQQDFPRYHEAQKTIAISQNETKYKNMRMMILVTLIFSLINCVSLLLANTFYLFSAYIPLVFISSGVSLYAETGLIAFYIVATVLAIVTLIPYLLAFIFSKKHLGWMIAALVIFSVDTLMLLVDALMTFDSALIVCLLIHIYILVMLALGVKYGKLVKQEREAEMAAAGAHMDPYAMQTVEGEAAVEAEVAHNPAADVRRTITVIRKKSFVGCALPFDCYVGTRSVFSLKNGKSDTFEATGESFVLRAGTSNGMVVGEVVVPEGADNLTYEISMKMGMLTNFLEIKDVTPPKSEF